MNVNLSVSWTVEMFSIRFFSPELCTARDGFRLFLWRIAGLRVIRRRCSCVCLVRSLSPTPDRPSCFVCGIFSMEHVDVYFFCVFSGSKQARNRKRLRNCVDFRLPSREWKVFRPKSMTILFNEKWQQKDSIVCRQKLIALAKLHDGGEGKDCAKEEREKTASGKL